MLKQTVEPCSNRFQVTLVGGVGLVAWIWGPPSFCREYRGKPPIRLQATNQEVGWQPTPIRLSDFVGTPVLQRRLRAETMGADISAQAVQLSLRPLKGTRFF